MNQELKYKPELQELFEMFCDFLKTNDELSIDHVPIKDDRTGTVRISLTPPTEGDEVLVVFNYYMRMKYEEAKDLTVIASKIKEYFSKAL